MGRAVSGVGMNAQTGAIRHGRKFEQVIDGARAVFVADGYDGASVDAIARAAKVSKATLYSYFPDKRRLFMEIAKRECQRQADAAIARIDISRPPEVVLFEAASTMVRFFLSEFGRQSYRIAVAEAGRFPEIGEAFYASGPAMARDAIAAYLRDRSAAGELRQIADTDLAADQFIALCKASLHIKWIMGIAPGFADDEIDRVIRGAVETFMARYGAA